MYRFLSKAENCKKFLFISFWSCRDICLV